MTKVTKAVIAAAGFGTRFLPQTKAMPKEMLPIIDKPIIQYIVEDMVAAGITDIIIVGSSSKRAIEDHFDVANEDLLANLRAGGPKKQHYIDELEALSNLANFTYVRQKGPYGNATPLLSAAHLIGNEPFVYAYADDYTVATPNAFQQMISLYEELQGTIVQCMQISNDVDFERYGILGGQAVRDGVLKMDSAIEKPGRTNAPSDFASVGAYLFTPDVLQYVDSGLAALPEGKEFYVVDSLVEPMLKDGKAFYGCLIQNSKRYDTGDKLEYLKTVIDFGLAHEELGQELRTYMQERLNDQSN
jgi:UTP--glucose-1-phosphate uridylyltransferase